MGRRARFFCLTSTSGCLKLKVFINFQIFVFSLALGAHLEIALDPHFRRHSIEWQTLAVSSTSVFSTTRQPVRPVA
jgi:hypothetical protein